MSINRIEIQQGARPDAHEIMTAELFANIGKKVVFIAPLNDQKNADIIIDGVEWEIKCPIGTGKYTIQHAFRRSVKQSENVVFDLRHSRASDEYNLSRIRKVFNETGKRKVKRLVVITKSKKLLNLA